MVLIIRKKATEKELEKISRQFKGYIKVVVDVGERTLAAGAERHVDEEKVLLAEGSKQGNLWGGGFDIESREIDYNSIINLRPNQGNPSRDILDKKIRKNFDTIIKKLLLK